MSRIALLYGGDSRERPVSIVSAGCVEEALEERGHWVYPLDLPALDLAEFDKVTFDVAFLAMHGGFGEDGRLQAALERRAVAYTGSGPEASRLAMNKFASKRRFVDQRIPTPPFSLITADTRPADLRRRLDRLGFPVVLKPVDGGSSIDVTLVRHAGEAAAPLDRLLARYGRVLVERYVAGREFTVAVLGDRALPVVEIRTDREFYDYTAKYMSKSTQYVVSPLVPRYVRRAMEDMGIGAHRALGCRDFSRVDIRLSARAQPYVLEVNTLPGMTPKSLLPKAAAAAGISYPELCERMAEMAVRRFRMAG